VLCLYSLDSWFFLRFLISFALHVAVVGFNMQLVEIKKALNDPSGVLLA